MAVTDEKYFNEDESYTVAVPKEQEALKQHIAFSYPQWKLVDYDSFADAADKVTFYDFVKDNMLAFFVTVGSEKDFRSIHT